MGIYMLYNSYISATKEIEENAFKIQLLLK